ncbi:hypothetical protein BB561_006122 [Smittium simulii]|uniref:Coatomer subunit zeta n=1 Tax=Smittium simulii TaxID=133385 RepID=A0A2T9Y6I3_9FUNG|nr:hypothetical protein BB561_006122 [Smittium simulii]
MTNTSLYTVKAILFFDSDGKQVISKYYRRDPENSKQFATATEQKAFEARLSNKIANNPEEILLFEGSLVLFQKAGDLTFCLVGKHDENEILLSSILEGFIESLEILLRQNVDKRSVLDALDIVLLALDETIDDGVVLETDAEIIASRVSKRSDTADMNLTMLKDQTLLEAYKQAKEKFSLLR